MTDRPILVVEDDEDVAKTIVMMLERDGWSTQHASSLAQGFSSLAAYNPCIVIVDLGLPDGSGMNMVREASARECTGVIVISGRGDEVDRVVGLEVGADDYISKPFSSREVNARVRALYWRLKSDTPQKSPAKDVSGNGKHVLTAHGATIDPARLRLSSADGSVINLTGGEADLLAQLMESGDEPLTREAVAKRILGHQLQPQQRGVDQLASSLRQEVDKISGGGIRIVAARGKGYRLIY